jgi:hypothetical protein
MALWYTPRLPAVPIRDVLMAEPGGNPPMEAFFGTDLQVTPEQMLAWVIKCWSLEVIFKEARARLGLNRSNQPIGAVLDLHRSDVHARTAQLRESAVMQRATTPEVGMRGMRTGMAATKSISH